MCLFIFLMKSTSGRNRLSYKNLNELENSNKPYAFGALSSELE